MEKKDQDPNLFRDHLANERTFLAWIRTCLGIMAFGFIVQRFTLFTKEIAILLGKDAQQTSAHLSNYSYTFGLILIALGGLIGLLAYIKYKKVQKQIIEKQYVALTGLEALITATIVITGLFLLIYLIVL